MDEETKKAALDKAESMSTHIAYPDELLNDTKLEEFYRKLEISPGNYLQSMLNLTLFGTEYSFEKLRQPVNKSDWISHGRPAIVNAFYSSIENSIRKLTVKLTRRFIIIIEDCEKNIFFIFYRIPCWNFARRVLQQ